MLYILHQEDNTYTSFEGGPFDEFNFCYGKRKRFRNKSQLIALLETNNGISSARGKNANEDLKPLKTSDHCQ
jgi:hypothetical protein